MYYIYNVIYNYLILYIKLKSKITEQNINSNNALKISIKSLFIIKVYNVNASELITQSIHDELLISSDFFVLINLIICGT